MLHVGSDWPAMKGSSAEVIILLRSGEWFRVVRECIVVLIPAHFPVDRGSDSVGPVPTPTAAEWIGVLADAGSFRSWDVPAHPGPGMAGSYLRELAAAREATGADESVRTGAADVGGVPSALVVFEFGFLGGSVGVATAARIVAAVRRATAQRRPLLVVTRSGGTRMQEGTPAFVEMAAITGAASAHRRAGLPTLVHLGGPTSGGVLATLGSLGDRTTAEPGAMVGFIGPRAVQAITGRRIPEGVQVAESLALGGVIDAVAEPADVRRDWQRLVRAWHQAGRVPHADAAATEGTAGPDGPAPAGSPPRGAPRSPEELWSAISTTRDISRPGAPDLVDRHVTDLVELTGTGTGRRASGVRVGVGRLGGAPVLVAATTDRRTGEPLTAGGLATMRRGIELAGRWGLPVVTLIDTLGAELSAQAELAGIAGEIARTMLAMVEVPGPSVAVLLGPGTGGAALALLPADRVVAARRSWICALAPEGAAAIRRSVAPSPAQVALQQRVDAPSLAALGLVDLLLDDTGPGWLDAAAVAAADALAEAIADPAGSRRLGRFRSTSAALAPQPAGPQ